MSANATVPESSEARELTLISKVELRIALADTDSKLQTLLNTYLAPLLLKLASESLAVRNKVISVCQHINTRIQPQSIQLPVPALLKQFKEQNSALIRHFDLLYIQQGISRITPAARTELLPSLLQGIAGIGTDGTQGAVVFNLVLRLLPLLKLPQKGSQEDLALREKLGLSSEDTAFLSSWFGKLSLLSPGDKNNNTCPGIRPSEYIFLNKGASPAETWDPSANGGLNLTETKVTVAKFIASGCFTDSERFLPAVIASADANSRLSDIGEDMLKRFTPDLENPDVVQSLYTLYFGTGGPDGAPPARPALRVKLLHFLGRSIKATADTQSIVKILDEGLFSDEARSAQGLLASKLRAQIFTFTTWVVRMGPAEDLKSIAPKIISGLRDFVQSQGWPNPGTSGQTLSPADTGLRSLAYESIGMLTPKVESDVQEDTGYGFKFGLVRWLFTSLSSDASSSQIFVSIEQALGSVLNAFANSSDEEFREQLRPFLVHHMNNQPGQDDSISGYKIVRSTRFATVRFANRCLAYGDVVARWIDLMAIAGRQDKEREVVEEGRKGLHPYWYRMLNVTKSGTWTGPSSEELDRDSTYRFPSFHDLTRFLFSADNEEVSLENGAVPGSKKFSGPLVAAFAPAIAFARNILLWEAFSKSGVPVEIEQDWEYRLDALLASNEAARSALKQHIKDCDRATILSLLSSALNGLVWNDGEGLEQCGVHFVDISSVACNDIVGALAFRAPSLKESMSSNKKTTQETAARAFGILASHVSLADVERQALLADLMQRVRAWKGAVGQVANHVSGSLLGLTYLLSRSAFRKKLNVLSNTIITESLSVTIRILQETRDTQLREAAQTALGQLSLSGVITPAMLPQGAEGWKMVRDKLLQDGKKESQTAISTIGRFSLIFPKRNNDGEPFAELLTCLNDLHEVRSPETQFTVGEALSTTAVGWASKSL
ncbi:proteasome component (Ecm29), putative, partial [Paecilomyces variotii No. 5]